MADVNDPIDILPEYQQLLKKLDSVQNDEEYNSVVKEIDDFRNRNNMKDYIDIGE
jgi:hypothetical protein